jgi:CDP-6-deoxy-D-xylo-4-hexulose-3-dehydrase
MINNIVRSDLDKLIEYLKKDDPKLTHGPLVRDFETAWSQWLGVEYSVMVNSGASANELTMRALMELHGPGEVIVPPLTWVSDIASILNAGMRPIFVDINLENLSFDVSVLNKAITNKTRAIFITHVLGLNALSLELIQIASRNNIPIIEDVCESHGATFQGQKAGSIGFASNFSFYYAHHMTTIEGGMISTNDRDFFECIRMLRSHGMVREAAFPETKSHYQTLFPDLNPDFIFAYSAHNMRPTEINGILGLSQLERLDYNIEQRTLNFRVFLENLDPKTYFTNFVFEGSSSYAFPIILNRQFGHLNRSVEEVLRENKIEFRRGLSGGGNQLRQPYLRNQNLNVNLSDFPVVDYIHFNSWYVGNYPELPPNRIRDLCEILNSVSVN